MFEKKGALTYWPKLNSCGITPVNLFRKIAEGCHLQFELEKNVPQDDGRIRSEFTITGAKQDIKNYEEIINALNPYFGLID